MTRFLATYLLAAVAAGALSNTATAQDLTKEITVEHEVVPEKRDAAKLNIYPTVNASQIPAPALNILYAGQPVGLTPHAAPLPVAAWGDSLITPSTRGYAALGYFPAWNLSASAGYRFIDTRKIRVNAWAQFTGASYSGHLLGYQSKHQLQYNAAAAGAALDYTPDTKSAFRFTATYGYDSRNMPDGTALLDATQRRDVNRVDIDARFRHTGSSCTWHAGATYALFANSHNPLTTIYPAVMPTFPGVTENRFAINGGIATAGTPSVWSIDVMADFYRRSSHATIDSFTDAATLTKGNTRGVISATPAYRIATRTFTARLGVRVDGDFGSSFKFRIAPDVNLCWTPASRFAIYASATGGTHVNSLGSLFAITPYASPVMAYNNSHVVFDARGGMRIGPFKGFAIDLHGGYAMANNWLMPEVIPDITIFHAIKRRGGIAGATLSYENSRWGHASVTYDRALTSDGVSSGYYLWADRAMADFRAELTATPITPLAVTVRYHARNGRHVSDTNLHTISALDASASYSLNNRWGFFLELNNLLCKRYYMLGNVESQGFNGMAGFTCKF